MFKNFLKSIKLLVSVYLAIILLLVYLGYEFYRTAKIVELEEWQKALESISQNKASAVYNWKMERTADAFFLFNHSLIHNVIESYSYSHSKRDSIVIVQSIQSIFKNHDYSDIFIIDPSKKILVNLNPNGKYNILEDSLKSSIKKKEIVFSNLYYDKFHSDVVIDVYAPIICDNKYVAAVIFKINPHKLLFPMITSSYNENTTSESLIFTAEQDSITFISPLKNGSNKSILYKRSINDLDLPAVKFVKDHLNTNHGTDYRGKEVIANIRAIDKTPWVLVTKVDLSEVYEPVYEDTVKNILIFGAIIIIGGLALLVYYTVANYNNLKSINEAEKKFKKIFDNSIEAIVIISNNKITDCNPHTSSLLGVAKPSLVGKSLSDFSPAIQPDGRNSSETISKLVELSLTGNEHQFEWAFLCSGKLIFTDINLSNFTVNGKKLSAAFIRDITARTFAEESNRKLSRAVEYSPLSIFITDYDANIEYVNPKFTNLTGYFPEEVLGMNPKFLSSGQTDPSVYKDMWDTIKAGEAWSGEFCNKKKNGELFWEFAIISPIKDTNNNITHFLAIKEDITEKKKTTDYLALQSTMLESIGQSVIAIKPDATIMYQNSMAEKLFGWTFDEIAGKNIIEVGVPEEHIDNAKQILFNLFREGSYTGELIVKRKDGSQFPVLISGAKVNNHLGEIIGFIGVFTDLTEIKRREAELKLAKENAEEMNKLKSSFLANMSHELRTPLTGILGFTEILKDEVPDEGQREMVEYIKISGQRLLTTFNSILDLSSIEANEYKVNYSDINITELLQKEINLFKSAADSKEVEIILEVPEDISVVNSDEHILKNIISNLINNAVKFTHTGKITVGCYFSEMFSAQFLNIFVRDTGIGIPDDAKQLIFDEFRQVSEGLGRSYEGSGLGLAITSKFVKLLNGEINVFSKVGLGSEFVVKIPVGQTSVSSAKTQIGGRDFVSVKIEKEKITNGKVKILIVEDDESNSSFITHVLESKYSVDLADNGKTAIKMATDSSYDLVLMDINLGAGMDGLLVSKTLRSIDKYANVPIIAITAYAMAGDKAKFISEGFTDYIAKPFAVSELLNIVSKHIKANPVPNPSVHNK